MTPEQKIAAALEMAKTAISDGAHHKQWTIDQMVRLLAGEDYERWVADVTSGEDGPDTYAWDVGLPA